MHKEDNKKRNGRGMDGGGGRDGLSQYQQSREGNRVEWMCDSTFSGSVTSNRRRRRRRRKKKKKKKTICLRCNVLKSSIWVCGWNDVFWVSIEWWDCQHNNIHSQQFSYTLYPSHIHLHQCYYTSLSNTFSMNHSSLLFTNQFSFLLSPCALASSSIHLLFLPLLFTSFLFFISFHPSVHPISQSVSTSGWSEKDSFTPMHNPLIDDISADTWIARSFCPWGALASNERVVPCRNELHSSDGTLLEQNSHLLER